MKKRTNNKRTGTDSGSKLYRKRLARLGGAGRSKDTAEDRGFDGVMEPIGVLTEGDGT